MSMTGRERMIAAFAGKSVDRAPIWLREGFDLYEKIPSENDFTQGWKAATIYRQLLDEITPFCDIIRPWHGHAFNRYMMAPASCIESHESMGSDDLKRIEGVIHTPSKTLNFVSEVRRGAHTPWHVKKPVESIEDLEALISIPFAINLEKVRQDLALQRKIREEVGDHGVTSLSISSPIVTISGCMDFQHFLEISLTERKLLHELLGEITRRTLLAIDAYFENDPPDTIVNMGGSEQCTPPMMSPRSFDEYVLPYDKPIVDRLKQYGIQVSCHCHGRIKHALSVMTEIGYDATDPVEPPPAGDIIYAEAREIAAGRITLIGNLEWTELQNADPAHIQQRVKDILSHGKDRLILAASAGPISAIDKKVADNYRAWIQAYIECNETRTELN